MVVFILVSTFVILFALGVPIAFSLGLSTVATMLVTVAVGYLGISRLPLGRLERYSHALAGLALVACGLAIQFGM